MVIIAIKVVYLCAMMLLAIRAHHQLKGSYWSFVTVICTFYFFDVRLPYSFANQMISLLIFDLTGKYILMLYLLLLLSSYATYALYYFLLCASPYAACSRNPK